MMLVCLAVTAASAGKYNTVLNIGETAPAWSELPGTDDREHSLQTLEQKKVVVVAFTCNSCPYAVDAEDRLNALVSRFEDKSVAVVAINVNKVEEDQMPAMKRRAKEKGFEFAYLWDESQQIAKEYGAKYTPEFYVLDEDRKVVYMGAMDDSPAGDEVTKTYLIDAIEATLAGREVQVTETIPIGCRIRIERQRRTR
ncbi:thioredoxin family protein [Stieleria magnilauensis]